MILEIKKGVITSQVRDQIIESALVLFEEYGFHGVTVNQIVENIGKSKGGFYHHFSTKDELLFVIHDTFITYALEKAIRANNTYESPTKRLQLIIKNFVSIFDLYKAHIAVFYQESIYLLPEYEVLIKKKRDQFSELITQVIRDGIVCQEFRKDLSVEITSKAILGMVNWTYKWYKISGTMTIDEIGDVFIDLILRSVLNVDPLMDSKFQHILNEKSIL